ncbi:MAG: amidohydrolase family protein [Candidatus Sigynarchaeota archaeon]
MPNRAIDEAVENTKIIDTHEHFSDSADIIEEGANLFAILPRGYVGFFDFYPGLRPDLVQFTRYPELQDLNYAKLKQFVDGYREHEFVDVLDAGIRYLHGGSIKRLTKEAFEALNRSMGNAYGEPAYRDRVLKGFNVERVICDIPYHSGGLGKSMASSFDPDMYKPAMRINSLLFGFDPGAWSPCTCLLKIAADELDVIPGLPLTFNSFLDGVDAIIDWSRGRVASYKCASAYERTIDFGTARDAAPGSRKWDSAKKAFGKPFRETTEQERLAFGDVVMHHVLGRIEGTGIPLQIHTGTAIMPGSNPKHVEPLIGSYPALDFTLLHCGFPWVDETIDIVKRHANAYAEMAWIQMLSREAATKFLARAIAEGLDRKVIAFGGDCACIEGSTGALLVLKQLVKETLARCVDKGVIRPEDSVLLVDRLFYENPRDLFFKKNG